MGRQPKTASPSTASRADASPSVAWPQISRAHDPEVEIVLEHQIVLVHRLFTAKTCRAWQDWLATLAFEPAKAPRKGEAARGNSRLAIEDAEQARRLWEDTGLQDALARLPDFDGASGLNANLRLYRYEPGQAFARHYDDSTVCPSTRKRTRWTLLVYLSGEEDGVRGGETAFYEQVGRGKEQAYVVPLTRGTALLHAHGAQCLPHEGCPVTAGSKLVLRSDVTF